MEGDRDNLRRASAMSFFESLDELQETLQETEIQNEKLNSQPSQVKSSKPPRKQLKSFDFSELEAAAADIEEFFLSQYPESLPPNE
jgi:hypothetical protein